MATVKAYRYKRNVIDDGIHGYGRTLTEIAIELQPPESKHFRWLISNESATFFSDKAFAGLAQCCVRFYEGMTDEEMAALTDEQDEAHKQACRDKVLKKDTEVREKSRKSAEVIEIPGAVYDRMVKTAKYGEMLDQLKKELKEDLKDILGKSKGYVSGMDD